MYFLLFIGTKPYAVIKGNSDLSSYLLDNYGFCFCQIPCFDSLEEFEEWNEGEFNGFDFCK